MLRNIPRMLIFIDYQKAFDSLEWDFTSRCLEAFNFGADFMRWVKSFYYCDRTTAWHYCGCDLLPCCVTATWLIGSLQRVSCRMHECKNTRASLARKLLFDSTCYTIKLKLVLLIMVTCQNNFSFRLMLDRVILYLHIFCAGHWNTCNSSTTEYWHKRHLYRWSRN